MRMLMLVRVPVETANAMIRDGTLDETMGEIVEEIGPEAVYLTELDGQRAAILVVDVTDPSRIPSLAEPFFLRLDADVEFKICMTPEDMERAGLDELGERWG